MRLPKLVVISPLLPVPVTVSSKETCKNKVKPPYHQSMMRKMCSALKSRRAACLSCGATDEMRYWTPADLPTL